jgi:hypothetical protein
MRYVSDIPKEQLASHAHDDMLLFTSGAGRFCWHRPGLDGQTQQDDVDVDLGAAAWCWRVL